LECVNSSNFGESFNEKSYIFLALFLVLFSTTLSAGHHGHAKLNDRTVRDYFNGWDTADIEKVMSYFSADIVYEDVLKAQLASGTVAVKAFVQQFNTDFAGARLAVESVTIGKKGAAAEWIISGGSGDEAWSVRSASIMEHKGGKISKVTDYWDK
jgi:ketosteroid isomerase-like protein